MKPCRRSWVEIDLSILLNNLKIYQSIIPDNTRIMAVVKADAYGHGDAIVSKFLSENGIHDFAVSNIDEAIHIRKSGVKGQILILGYTPIDRLYELLDYDITQALVSEEYAEQLSKTCPSVKCQFAIDTGMNRIGLNGKDASYCESVIRNYSKKISLNGCFTHLCVADTENTSSKEFTARQIDLFVKIISRVKDLHLPYNHCLNSAGGMWHSCEESCFARLGIVLYGLKPDYSNTIPEGIKPVLSWKSVVSMVKIVEEGDTIGYGRSFCAPKTMSVATIPTGYADGYSRLLSNKGWVLINGERAPIVGRVCMDQMMVDVSNISNVEMGTEVVLLGNSGDLSITADDLAHLYGTIGYEVLCGINKRVDREYI